MGYQSTKIEASYSEDRTGNRQPVIGNRPARRRLSHAFSRFGGVVLGFMRRKPQL
jgi:hypothetical protein